MTTTWQIPPSTLAMLDEAPTDRPVVVLLRHSVRGHLPPGPDGANVPILPIGEELAIDLGKRMAGRLVTLETSPLLRCRQTCAALAAGARVELSAVPNRLLGDPGAYVLDGDIAWPNWQRWGHEGVMARFVGDDVAMDGMAEPEPAARLLVDRMFAIADGRPGLHVFLTHDSLVTATAARLLRERLGVDDWPWYLEAAWFWRDQGRQVVRYKERTSTAAQTPLCDLQPADVLAFARREIAATIGLNSGARFFLAGCAFRALLTGHPPHDLDIWPASAEDRATIIGKLMANGAEPAGDARFADAFRIADRLVEVAHKVEPSELAERLARFDLALSAVGVEHRADGTWGVQIHPRAIESARRREVLALLPLANPKYMLTTLERARRYAAELGYRVAAETEDAVWSAYDAGSAEDQRGYRDRLANTSRVDLGVLEEARCRSR